MLGLPAGLGAAGSLDYNFPPDQLAVAYKVINALTAVGALRALIDFTPVSYTHLTLPTKLEV